jgi:hypothetical protein
MSRVGGLFIASAIVCALGLSGSVVSAQNDRASDEMPGVYYPDSVVAEVQKSPACPNDVCPGLGNAFYLPETNASNVNTGGFIFFSDRKLGSCVLLSSLQRSTRDFQSAESMEQFITSAMTEASIAGNLSTAKLTIKATAEALTGSSTDIKTEFHSTHMDIALVTSTADFQRNSKCYSAENLDKKFLQMFEALPPINAAQVSESGPWDSYVRFLGSVGSHIMTQQQIGSRFQQWESATSTEKEISKLLRAKACAEVEGTKGTSGWSVKSCAGYSEDEKRKALQLSTKSQLVVLGGTDKARYEVIKSLDANSLASFIDSASEGDGAVRFMFRPIWELLYNIYGSECAKAGKGSRACEDLQRAVNLQAAFEGWSAISCPRQVDGRGMTFQTMAVDSTDPLGINTYKCTATKTGCRTNDDCRLGGVGTSCYCYGPSCIDKGDPIANTYRNKVRGNKEGGYKDGVNNACYWAPVFHCDCNKSWSGGLLDRNIYQQSVPPVLLLSGH